METPNTALLSGTVLIPPDIQRAVGAEDGAPLVASVQEGSIILTPVRPPSMTDQEADAALEQLFGAFATKPGEPSLSDELARFRAEEREHEIRKWGF